MKNLTIGKQLSIGFGLLLALLICTVVFSLYQQDKLASLTDIEFQHPFAVTNAVARADGNMMRMSRTMKDVATSTDDSQAQHFISIVNELEPKVQEDLALGKERFLGDKADFDALIGKFNEWKPIRDKVIALKSQGKLEEATQVTRTEGIAKLAEIDDLRKKVYAAAWGKGEDLHIQANEVRLSSRFWTIASGTLIVLIGIAAAVFITRSLTRSINQAVHVAHSVAAGDLTVEFQVDGSKEAVQLLMALKEMQQNLTKIVANVRQDSENIATASAQIASGNLDLSARTEAQAGALEETASSMEELTSTVKQNAENADQARQMAQSASEIATKGGAAVSDVVMTMDAISESSKKIVDIISVIDGIAFQTNILALNAAVEAARAGEQGRGFAVVAAEVRNLAQRSAGAAKEIKELIGSSVEKVETGNRLVNQAGDTMNEMVKSIKGVTDIIAEITEASREQSAGIDQINTAITEMDNVTQQNAALVEQAAAAAGSMQEQAAGLLALVSVFKLNHTSTPAVRAVATKSDGVRAAVDTAPDDGKPKVPRIAAKNLVTTSPKRIAGASSAVDDWEQF